MFKEIINLGLQLLIVKPKDELLMPTKFKLLAGLITAFMLFSSASLFSQTKITGKVVGSDLKPIAGATVTVKGTTVATTTNLEGVFLLEVPKNRQTVVISSIGYEAVEQNISADNTALSITMKPQTTSLNEVVLTGYTSQRRKDITGAVSIVPVGELKAQPSFDVGNQLQGKASGVTVTESGVPGTPASVRIRGLGSFNNNSPLYVIDGVQTTNVSGLTPDDVETMLVLKDAASASIYGVRASNGVIVITTKQGRKRGVSVTYNGYYGTQNPGKGMDLLSPQEAGELYFLSQKNVGLPTAGSAYGNGATPTLPDYIYYTGYAVNGTPITNSNPGVNASLYSLDYSRLGDVGYTPYIIVPANKSGTDWYQAITRNAPITNQNLTLSGATDNSHFLMSLNYFNQDAITQYQFYRRFSIRMNSEFNVMKGVRVGENIQAFMSTANTPGSGNGNGTDNDDNTEASVISQTYRINSIVPIYTINPGDFAGNKGGPGGGVGTWGNSKNPLAQLYRKKDNRNNNVNVFGNVYGEVDFLQHFTVRTSFGGSNNNQDIYTYPFIEYEDNENTGNTTYTENMVVNNSWIWTNTLTYKNIFGKNNLTVLVGTEAQKSTGRQIIGTGTGYYAYNYKPYINLNNGAVAGLGGSQSFTPTTLESYFAKADYVYDNKYLLSALIRRDGSSKFVAPNQYANFPAFSVGWRISEENFLKSVTWLNDLKLRGSWGKLGNEAAVSASNAYTTFGSNKQSSWYDINGTNNTPAEGFYLSFVGNQLGQWETSTSTNYGFDMTVLGGSTSIIFDYYQKNTSHLLYNPSGQGILGAVNANTPAYQNVGSMANWGIDLGITNRAKITRDLTMTTAFTFTTYKNKVTAITQDGQLFFQVNSPLNEQNRIGSVVTRNIVGQPLNTFYGYKVLGLFQNAAEVTKSAKQADAAPGRFKYADINNDGVIDASDRTVIGNPNPGFSYGLNLGLEYQAFDFTAFFYGVGNKQAFNYSKYWTDFTPGAFPGGRSKNALYDSWLPDGSRPNAKTPMAETNVGTGFSDNSNVNSYYVESASYFRLRNLQIGYTLPVSLTNKLKISKARFYIQGTNLFTVTNYTGLNPEVTSSSDLTSSIDMGSYPVVREYLIGASITF